MWIMLYYVTFIAMKIVEPSGIYSRLYLVASVNSQPIYVAAKWRKKINEDLFDSKVFIFLCR